MNIETITEAAQSIAVSLQEHPTTTGELFRQRKHLVTLAEFQAIIDGMKEAGLVTECSNHILTWNPYL